jgi:hypothetical protein
MIRLGSADTVFTEVAAVSGAVLENTENQTKPSRNPVINESTDHGRWVERAASLDPEVDFY